MLHAIVAGLEDGGKDAFVAKVGRVLELNGRGNGLETQLAGILAEAMQAVNRK